MDEGSSRFMMKIAAENKRRIYTSAREGVCVWGGAGGRAGVGRPLDAAKVSSWKRSLDHLVVEPRKSSDDSLGRRLKWAPLGAC